jgi:hypothetical protein
MPRFSTHSPINRSEPSSWLWALNFQILVEDHGDKRLLVIGGIYKVASCIVVRVEEFEAPLTIHIAYQRPPLTVSGADTHAPKNKRRNVDTGRAT